MTIVEKKLTKGSKWLFKNLEMNTWSGLPIPYIDCQVPTLNIHTSSDVIDKGMTP